MVSRVIWHHPLLLMRQPWTDKGRKNTYAASLGQFPQDDDGLPGYGQLLCWQHVKRHPPTANAYPAMAFNGVMLQAWFREERSSMLMEFTLLFSVAICSGFFGAIVGIGGGVIIVPALTLLFHIPIHNAIAASIISVIATSIAGAWSHVDQRTTNVRLAMFLEIATTFGALTGALIGVLLHGWILSLIFGILVFYVVGVSFRTRKAEDRTPESANEGLKPAEGLAHRLGLQGEFYDQAEHRLVRYHATGAMKGSLVAMMAGIGSGLLGIGGGIFKVAAMNSFMGIPMKAAAATSKFMIGITAATSAIVYFLAGGINQYIVAPVVLGTMLGATVGSYVMNRLHGRVINTIFILLLFYLGYQMLAKGIAMGFGLKLPGLL